MTCADTLLLQVVVYCTLLPVREKGDLALPAAVAAYLDKVAADPAVKAGSEQVCTAALQLPCQAVMMSLEAAAFATTAVLDHEVGGGLQPTQQAVRIV